jgi:biopolymer transport protein TolR
MRQRRLMNEINVVPYIDVMLVLLVIFMVAAPMMQQTGSVDLPTVGKLPNPPTQSLQVTVKSDKTLELRDVGRGKDSRKVTRDQLVDELRAALARDAQIAVAIAADKSVRYEEVIAAMDAVKGAGITRVGLIVAQK